MVSLAILLGVRVNTQREVGPANGTLVLIGGGNPLDELIVKKIIQVGSGHCVRMLHISFTLDSSQIGPFFYAARDSNTIWVTVR